MGSNPTPGTTMEKPFILFDFDGVIADSSRLSFEIAKMVYPRLIEDAYRKLFEGNINDHRKQQNVYTAEYRHDVDFDAEYNLRMKKEVKIVSGMKEIVIELEKNYTLIVVSSTVTSPIKEFLEEHNLASHFAQIMGNDVHKSKIEKIKMVFGKYSIGPKDCVFITDTLGDMREATHAGVEAVGVTWGFHKPETLLKGEPFRLVDKPADLLIAVADYFKARN